MGNALRYGGPRQTIKITFREENKEYKRKIAVIDPRIMEEYTARPLPDPGDPCYSRNLFP
jgi:hypothetical protein